MMKLLRSQSQAVLIVVLGVIALGFLFYGNAGNLLTSNGPRASTDYGRIDGQDLSVAELSDAVRAERNSLLIQGQGDALRQPGIGPEIAQLAWQRLLVEREADRLHISISDKEVVDFMRSLPPFQKDGVYSPEAYDAFIQKFKSALRLPTDSGVDPVTNAKNVLEAVFRDDLLIEAVKKALFNGVRSSTRDVADQYEKYYGPVTVTLATIDPKTLATPAQVTPAEIEAEYKAHPENPDYRTKEKRKIDYVLFLLSPEQEKLPDAQKTAAKDALGQKALDFALTFQPEPSETTVATPSPTPDFLAQAKKAGVAVATTDFFTADSVPAGVPPSPAFNNAAFELTKDNAMSKVVVLDNGVALLHLNEIQPSDLRPFDEVKGDIAKHLQQTKTEGAGRVAAQIAATQLKGEVAKGTDFKAAATALKLKVETLSPIVPMNTQSADQRTQSIAAATFSLKPGEVSEAIPTGSGDTMMVVHLDVRGNADAAGLATFETRYRNMQDERLRGQVFTDWANWKSKQPGTHKPPELDAFGSVE